MKGGGAYKIPAARGLKIYTPTPPPEKRLLAKKWGEGGGGGVYNSPWRTIQTARITKLIALEYFDAMQMKSLRK